MIYAITRITRTKSTKDNLFKKKFMSVITSDSSSSSSEESEENEFDDQEQYIISSSSSGNEDNDEQSNKAICGECGKELDAGWTCSACRKECPLCNRALSNDPNEYCERCFKFCKYHGLYSKSKDGLFICNQCASPSSSTSIQPVKK